MLERALLLGAAAAIGVVVALLVGTATSAHLSAAFAGLSAVVLRAVTQ